MSAVRVVRERIDPRLTSALFANYRTPIDAILELIDNAVDSRVVGRPLSVELVVRAGSITLTTTGGSGMGPGELEREYLRWGASRKRAGERIGRFGQGGKAAIGHLGARFSIVASRAGDERAFGFRDDEYRDRRRLRTYELTERPKPVERPLGYMRIEIGAVDKKFDGRKLRARLAETYRPLLDGGALALRLDGADVRPTAWPVDERREFAVRAGGRLLHGWYGVLREEALASTEPGIRLYHLGRLFGAPDWFGHPGPALHPGLNRLMGEVELPHVSVTMNKSDVERGTDEWASIEQRMHRLLAPVVRLLTRESGNVPSPQAVRTAEQVRRILARALRLLESGKLFESEPGTAGEGPNGQLTLAAAAREQPPAEPPPPTSPSKQDPPRPDRLGRRAAAGVDKQSAKSSCARSIRGCAAPWSSRMASGGW